MAVVRVVGALALVGATLAWALGQPPLPPGPILWTISESRGVDLRDLLALPFLAGAVVLVWPRRRAGRGA